MKTPGCFLASPDAVLQTTLGHQCCTDGANHCLEQKCSCYRYKALSLLLGRSVSQIPTTARGTGRGRPCPAPSLTWVILARSSEGRSSCASWGRRRLTPTFLSLRTQGCERLRHSPPARRPSCGVEAGVLLAEGGPGSEEEKRS